MGNDGCELEFFLVIWHKSTNRCTLCPRGKTWCMLNWSSSLLFGTSPLIGAHCVHEAKHGVCVLHMHICKRMFLCTCIIEWEGYLEKVWWKRGISEKVGVFKWEGLALKWKIMSLFKDHSRKLCIQMSKRRIKYFMFCWKRVRKEV